MTPSTDTAEGSSTAAAPSSGTGAELAVARKDPATGHYLFPSPVAGQSIEFRPGAKALTEEAMVFLGPLGIRREWDPAAVLHFLTDAARRGFDPFSKEIFLMRYQTRFGPQFVHHIGIHGMRRRAETTRLYGGVDPVRYCGDDGKWVEVWPYRDAAPYAAKVLMRRLDWPDKIEMVGYYDEFVPMVDEIIKDGKNEIRTGNKIPTPMWRPAGQGGKPTIMTTKCTRAMCFREGWTAEFSSWYEPAEFERTKVESDSLITARLDDRAQRRQDAYQAARGAQTVDGADLGVTLTEVPDPAEVETSPADRVREMFAAEIQAMAAILGKDVDFMWRRWSATRGGRSPDAAKIGEVAAHISDCRPFVITVLRQQGRDEMAARYAAAPLPGTIADLFGNVDPRMKVAA